MTFGACARLCHDAGGEIEQIQYLLGHESVQTTERYIGCKQRLRNASMIGSGWSPRTANLSDTGRLVATDLHAIGEMRMRASADILPASNAGRMLRTYFALSLLRFLRGPCAQLARLRWYKHAEPRCLKARRH